MRAFLVPALLVLVACTSSMKNGDSVIRQVAGVGVDESGYAYDPADTSCDGFPKLKVQTMKGTCLGIVFGHANAKGPDGKLKYKMPRTIVQVPGTEHFLLADMGGWHPNAGALFWIRHEGRGRYSLVKLLSGVDLPHGLAFNPRDQYFYLGENSKISRFHFNVQRGEVTDKLVVIERLPDVNGHMHPLTQFVFNPANGDLFINSGAPTDHCRQANGDYKKRCAETETTKMAGILKVSGEKLAQVNESRRLGPDDFQTVAQGLRNSMAMAIHPAGRFLIQGENSRDFPELEEPYEEMNIVRLDSPLVKHYGWPYCFDDHGTSPEWLDVLIKDKQEYKLTPQSELQRRHGVNPFYCGREALGGADGKHKEYQRPLSLIPPHAAPLHAAYYDGPMLSDLLAGKLIMSWHGYRTTGQRLVAYPVNGEGLPILSKAYNETYGFNLPDGCPKPTAFNPRGGFRKHFARYREVISGWAPIRDVRPKGSPTGFTVASDGSIWIVEDKNKTIVRLARDTAGTANYQQACATTPGQNKDYNVQLLAWRNVMVENPQMRDSYNRIATGLRTESRCLNCHSKLLSSEIVDSPDEFSTLDFFVRSEWLKPGKPAISPIYDALTTHNLVPKMPPSGFDDLSGSDEGRELIAKLENWITNLPQDVDARWSQARVTRSLNIRQKPGTDAKVCGAFEPDDVAYIDPRPDRRIQVGTTKWRKVYLLPEHTRLVPGACPAPIDGVYYSAL